MEITTGLLLLAVGVIAGGYGTIVGAGGGFIFVPALLLLFHMEPTIAAGSGIVIILINSLSGVFGYAKQKRINYRTGILLGIGAFPGSLLGVYLLHMYSSSYFYVVFASLLVALGVFLFAKNSPFAVRKVSREGRTLSEDVTATSPTDKPQLKVTWLFPLGFLMGVLSSYLGIGGGWLLVPILIYIFKVSTHYATATSIFSLTLYSSVGVVSQMFYSNIDWITVIWGGVGVIIGSQIGVLVAQRIPGKMIIQMLSVLLMVIGFRMYFT
ncbi:sulfite exporter TauE/SafE family protein [Neobacillus sp. OS1-2]|uniref:sulfite exporter TauE/SafE family protein n=1 Tax=Neobacillus sp. OS1-2 TaxID=3070680 RepID=UPI0027DEC015|nr:sulfite exporter TauE/SafE family protein [Neobacillus sp. OS1-2]WML41443.1 sulfite exporter TauE/SafE family protein [Neobacillus sp. OS1-2]